LKKKYELSDFMTSLHLWRALLPTNDNQRFLFPIPECDKLLALEYSQWNSSKGGSDTVTRFTYNCQSIVTVKSPQTMVVTRFLMLFSVLMHRASQAVTGTTAPDVNKDTIKKIREHDNQRLPFHQTLKYLSNRLIAETRSAFRGKRSALHNVEDSETGEKLKRKAAPLLNPRNKKSQFEINHDVLASSRKTGVTPYGKGRKVSIAEKHRGFTDCCRECPGRPIKLAKPKMNDNGDVIGFDDNKRQCYLCNKHGCTYMCIGCHRILCYETDCQSEIQAMLMDTTPAGQADRDRILKNVPDFADQHRNFAPAHWCNIGEINGQRIYSVMSCFHYCHPDYFLVDDDDDECRDEAEDTQLGAISEGPFAFSPNATR
jgi:hypothetical protein